MTFCKTPSMGIFCKSCGYHDTPARVWSMPPWPLTLFFLCPVPPIPVILSHCLVAEMHVPAALMAKMELYVTDGK